MSLFKFFGTLLVMLLLSSCAANKNPYQKKRKKNGEPCDCPDMKKNKRIGVMNLLDLKNNELA